MVNKIRAYIDHEFAGVPESSFYMANRKKKHTMP